MPIGDSLVSSLRSFNFDCTTYLDAQLVGCVPIYRPGTITILIDPKRGLWRISFSIELRCHTHYSALKPIIGRTPGAFEESTYPIYFEIGTLAIVLHGNPWSIRMDPFPYWLNNFEQLLPPNPSPSALHNARFTYRTCQRYRSGCFRDSWSSPFTLLEPVI